MFAKAVTFRDPQNVCEALCKLHSFGMRILIVIDFLRPTPRSSKKGKENKSAIRFPNLGSIFPERVIYTRSPFNSRAVTLKCSATGAREQQWMGSSPKLPGVVGPNCDLKTNAANAPWRVVVLGR